VAVATAFGRPRPAARRGENDAGGGEAHGGALREAVLGYRLDGVAALDERQRGNDERRAFG
jgi:hypothetical protein